MSCCSVELRLKLYLALDSEVQNPAELDYATLLAGFRNLRQLKLCMNPQDISKVHDGESMILSCDLVSMYGEHTPKKVNIRWR